MGVANGDDRSVAMNEHAVVIAGGGPTGLMLAGELALAGVDVAIVERRASQELGGSRAGGLHSRTIEVLDQRGIAERFLSQGQVHQLVHFHVPLDISDFPTRHNYLLGLWQNQRISPESLLDTYHAERHPVAARALRNTMAQIALRRPDDRTKALSQYVSELLRMDQPRSQLAAEMSGLGVHYDLGEGHPLLGRRMPDLDLITTSGPMRVFSLLHDARPVFLNLGEPGAFDITPWADRVRSIDATCGGTWELPAIGEVSASGAILIRPDGYVAWVGDLPQVGLADALTNWFGAPTAA